MKLTLVRDGLVRAADKLGDHLSDAAGTRRESLVTDLLFDGGFGWPFFLCWATGTGLTLLYGLLERLCGYVGLRGWLRLCLEFLASWSQVLISIPGAGARTRKTLEKMSLAGPLVWLRVGFLCVECKMVKICSKRAGQGWWCSTKSTRNLRTDRLLLISLLPDMNGISANVSDSWEYGAGLTGLSGDSSDIQVTVTVDCVTWYEHMSGRGLTSRKAKGEAPIRLASYRRKTISKVVPLKIPGLGGWELAHTKNHNTQPHG